MFLGGVEGVVYTLDTILFFFILPVILFSWAIVFCSTNLLTPAVQVMPSIEFNLSTTLKWAVNLLLSLSLAWYLFYTFLLLLFLLLVFYTLDLNLYILNLLGEVLFSTLFYTTHNCSY